MTVATPKKTVIEFDKRQTPTKTPEWRVYQRNFYDTKIKEKVDEKYSKERDEYMEELTNGDPSQSPSLKRPERVAIMNKMTREMFNDKDPKVKAEIRKRAQQAFEEAVQQNRPAVDMDCESARIRHITR